MGPFVTVEGSTVREAFEAHVEPVLALTLCAGQIVVMAKLSAYKGEKVRKVIEGQDCELLYLPPYSPDFKPIEKAFSAVKMLLHKAESRSRKVLAKAMGWAFSAVSARDTQGYFERCNYHWLAQLV